MADKPTNPKPDAKKLSQPLRPVAPKPDHTWPPPESVRPAPSPSPRTASLEPVELDWSDEVERIDQAINEIRKLNGGLNSHHAEDVDDDLLDDEPEGLSAGPAIGRDDLLPVGSTAALSHAQSPPIPAKRRIRPHSENELSQLWNNVFFSGEHAAPKTVVVTGARRGDGASQIAASLAVLGAEANEELRIVLVDFNLRDPAVAGLLGLKRESGLTDVLLGKVDLDVAIQCLSLKNGNTLHVLTGGARAEHPLALLKGRPARSLIKRLKDSFDHVIFDCPSSDRFADPQVIGAQVDAAILVCRAGQTPRESVAEARKRLDLAGVRCLGLVLNQRRDPIPSLLYRLT